MLEGSTAFGAYGFGGAIQVGTNISAETETGNAGVTPGNLPNAPLPLHWGNPLFWLLIAVLLFTGWVFGGFNVGGNLGVRKVARVGGSARVRGGR